jgi:hypothetical protein
MSQDAQAEFLRADEVSDDWNRCCCAPYHPLKVEFRQYIPMPGDGSSSDFSHLAGDISRDFGTYDKRRKYEFLQNLYLNQPVLFTMEREDGQRCCCKCPCKCLSDFVCCSFCQDNARIYLGSTPPPPEGKERGRPYGADIQKQIGAIIQPIFGGYCRPQLDLYGKNEAEPPFGVIQGPYCFGGWSELCCDFKFYVSNPSTGEVTGDLALITKKKPSSLAGAVVELMTDADVYTISFEQQAKLSAMQKATTLSAQIFIDYMLFDGNTEKCKDTDDGIYCYCWYCMIFGRLIPCYIYIPKNAS